mmetsp:Transcript_35315/g.34327  ORF Transcript_35315/g.34327 Transcript_35315/m.34327 type:complete len:228 (-) Transcript_35315:176-859(-)
MIFQDQFGKEYQQNLTNADLVFYNEFHEKFKQKEYTYYKKKVFMQKKFLISQYSKNPYQYCGKCFNSFSKRFGLFEQKYYCYFCLDYCCEKCLSNERTLIPNEFQLRGQIGKYTICKDAYDFLSKFSYVKIDKCNPLLAYTDQLKKLMVLRRKVHKVFDLIQCNKWVTIFEVNGFQDDKNLILRDCYFSFNQLMDFARLEKALQTLFDILLNHVSNCYSCYYKGEKC